MRSGKIVYLEITQIKCLGRLRILSRFKLNKIINDIMIVQFFFIVKVIKVQLRGG